jgi:hypothetical protein
MKTCVFTPPHETGILVAHIIPYAVAMTLAWGAKVRGRWRHLGAIFFRPLRVKGLFCARTGRAAFLFRRNLVESAFFCEIILATRHLRIGPSSPQACLPPPQKAGGGPSPVA